MADDHQVEFFAREERVIAAEDPLAAVRAAAATTASGLQSQLKASAGLACAKLPLWQMTPGFTPRAAAADAHFGMRPAGGRKRALRIDVGRRLGVMD